MKPARFISDCSVAWLLLALGSTSQAWTGNVRQVDAVILDDTRTVWNDGGNVLTQPCLRLIIVEGQHVSVRRLQAEPQVLQSSDSKIIIYSYWDESCSVRTQHYYEIHTRNANWLDEWLKLRQCEATSSEV